MNPKRNYINFFPNLLILKAWLNLISLTLLNSTQDILYIKIKFKLYVY